MQFKHVLLALTIALFWGGNFIVVKLGMEEVPPFLLLVLRFVFSTFPLIFFIPKPKNLSWSLMSGIALTMGVGKFSLVFLSIHLGLATGLASLLLQTHVLFTIILSKIIYKSPVSQRQALGMIISFIGIGAIAIEIGGEANLAGFICVMCSALFWAASNILFRKAKNVDAFSLVIWMGLIPPLPLLALSFYFEGSDAIIYSLSNFTYIGVLALAFIVIAATWIGTTLWAHLFKIYDASIVAPYALLIPVFGISLSWLVFDERYTVTTMFGCALVFTGLVINQWVSGKKEIEQNLKKAA
ncbi:MAG: EamA family transporter [Alphaproteobacteria bacterium]|nr:EamA family transporter [Alphaproteobacteria bacterium]